MVNENNKEDKRVEKLTDQEMEQVTGGIWGLDFLADWLEETFRGKEDATGYAEGYTSCPNCKDYTRTVYLSGKTVCAKCRKPKA